MTKREYEETKERRSSKRKKKKSHRLYALVVIILGVSIIALSVFLLFRVQKILIEGNDYCTDKEVRRMVQNDKYSTNSLYIIGKYITGHGEVLPCLEKAEVSMENPWTVKVVVKEKEIVGYLKKGKEYIYFDKEGLVVYKDTAALEGIPRVDGIEVENTDLYQTLKSGNSGIFKEVLETSRELKKYNLTTKKIEYENDHIRLYIKNVCINLGNTVSSEKIAQIPPIMEKLGKKKGTLHLENYSETSETITFNKGEYPKEK